MEESIMNEQLFWDMFADGRLAKLAREEPLEFEKLYDEIIEKTLATYENDKKLCDFSDSLTIKLLWESQSFEYEAAIHESRPEVYNFRRTVLLKAFHRSHANAQHPGLGERLQWRIDREIEKHATPLGACVALNRMMNESMWGENGLRDTLNQYFGSNQELHDVETKDQPTSEVSDSKHVVLLFKPRS